MIDIEEYFENKLAEEAGYILNVHDYMEYILHLSSGYLYDDFLRTIGYGIIVFLGWINDFIENIVDVIITFNNFYASGPVADIMETMRPIVWSVFFLALVILGFQFMLNKVEKRNEVILNIVLALSVIVVIPDLMVNLGKITSQGIDIINPKTESLAGTLMKSNIADVLYYAEKDFTFSNQQNGDSGLPPYPTSKTDSTVGTTDFTNANRFTNDSLALIPITEKLDIHEKTFWHNNQKEERLANLSDSALGVLSVESVPTGVGDGTALRPLGKNDVVGTKIGRESYYRYHVNWFVLIVSLSVTALAMVITIIKIGRNVFDLAFQQIFAMFISATDLTGGQRTKKVLGEIVSTFSVIFIMILLLRLFMLYTTWANGLKPDIGGIGVLLLLVAGAWALIDAPDIVQRVLGIDAGMRSGYQALVGGAVAAGAIGRGAKTAGKVVGAGARGGIGAVSSTSGGVKGAVDGMRGKNGAIPEGGGSNSSGSGGKTSDRKSNSNTDLNSVNTGQNNPSGGDEGVSNLSSNPPSEGGSGSSGTPPNSRGEGNHSLNIPSNGEGGDNNPPNSPRIVGAGENESNIPSGSSNSNQNNNHASTNKRKTTPPIGKKASPTGQHSFGGGPVQTPRNQNMNRVAGLPIGNQRVNNPVPGGHEQTPSGIIIPSTGSDRVANVQNSSGAESNKPTGSQTANRSQETSGSGILKQGTTKTNAKTVGSQQKPYKESSNPTTNTARINSTDTSSSSNNSNHGGYSSSTPNISSNQRSVNQQQANVNPKTEGHKEAVHHNTIMGNRKTVQLAKEKNVQGYNSGYNMGKGLREMGNKMKRNSPKEKRVNRMNDTNRD